MTHPGSYRPMPGGLHSTISSAPIISPYLIHLTCASACSLSHQFYTKIASKLKNRTGPCRVATETPGKRIYAWAQALTRDKDTLTAATPMPRLPSKPPPWKEPTEEHRQRESDCRLAKSNSSKEIYNHFTKQWQTSWDSYRSTRPEPSIALSTPLGKKRTRIHEWVANAESALATQIRTEKIGLAAFLRRQRVPTVASPTCPCAWHRQTAKHVIMFRPLYNTRGTGSVGAPNNYNKLVSEAQSLKNISSHFIKTSLAQFSVSAEQLYG